MISLEALFGLVITILLANLVLQLIFIVCWIRLVRPQAPLLKPATLCTTATSAGRTVLMFWRHARRLLNFEIPGHFSDREQITPNTTEKRIQEYV